MPLIVASETRKTSKDHTNIIVLLVAISENDHAGMV